MAMDENHNNSSGGNIIIIMFRDTGTSPKHHYIASDAVMDDHHRHRHRADSGAHDAASSFAAAAHRAEDVAAMPPTNADVGPRSIFENSRSSRTDGTVVDDPTSSSALAAASPSVRRLPDNTPAPHPHPYPHPSPHGELFRNDHESFLVRMARRECRDLPFREHRQRNDDAVARRSRRTSNNNGDNDEEWRAEERRRFPLLDFSTDDDVFSDSESSDSDSEEDSSIEEGEDDEDGEQRAEEDEGGRWVGAEDGEGEVHERIHEGGANQIIMGDDERSNAEPDRRQRHTHTHHSSAGEGASVDDNGGADRSGGRDNAVDDEDDSTRILRDRSASISSLQHAPPVPFDTVATSVSALLANNGNECDPNRLRMTLLLSSLANSEEEPLIRADIPWSAITSCSVAPPPPTLDRNDDDDDGHRRATTTTTTPSLLRTLYQQPGDPNGARLLQGVLRMDPPLEAVRALLDAFPRSCLDMEEFFTACQFAHPNTSSRRLPRTTGVAANDDDDANDAQEDDVGEVVRLVMHRTIRARRVDGVDWGMVAFLGDARINPSHARLLLRAAPEALVDPEHGAFGVSPLDRMASGFFIHGERSAWAEKLRLALRVAAYVRETRERRRQERAAAESLERPRREEGAREEEGSAGTRTGRTEFEDPIEEAHDAAISLPDGFFRTNYGRAASSGGGPPRRSSHPYHELIRRIASPTYRGNKFGRHGFLQTLRACTQSDPRAFLRSDDEGNLPIHVALGEECDTVLGVRGERRLIKYLLDLDGNVALCPEGGGGRRLPLRMSVENAWPVHDLIVRSALACRATSGESSANDGDDRGKNKSGGIEDHAASNAVLDQPLLHDALDGPRHPRFGIHGARRLVETILSATAQHRRQNAQGGDEGGPTRSLTNFADGRGRTALHVALENVWPVHDLVVRADPPCLEARDPTRHGFFPFQTAACAFVASAAPGREEEATGGGERPADPGPRNPTGGAAAGDRREAQSLMETSMLYELIRESPLCVTWRMSNAGRRDAGRSAEGGSKPATEVRPSLTRSTKRRRLS